MSEYPIVVVSGYVDPYSGRPCGWANIGKSCLVPHCEFPSQRCLCVQREHGRPPDVDSPPGGDGQQDAELDNTRAATVRDLEVMHGEGIIDSYDADN